jgi:hypothetical protein
MVYSLAGFLTLASICPYLLFLALADSTMVVWMKNCLSTNFNASSMRLQHVSTREFAKIFRSRTSKTYMTGALMMSTAFHSIQFRGRMENRPCRNGV